MKQIIILLSSLLLLSNCKKSTITPDKLYNVSMDINGTRWETTGSALWDVNSGGMDSSILVVTAGDIDEPEFGFVISGETVIANTVTKFIDGVYIPHIGHSYKGIDYNSRFGTTSVEVGSVTFGAIYDNSISGTFKCKLTSSNGAFLMITNGDFTVPLKRF